MLGSNQRPLPCELSALFTAAYRSLREMGLFTEISWHRAGCFYAVYRRFTPALLHGCCTRTSTFRLYGSTFAV
jgi:hypothetical protein